MLTSRGIVELTNRLLQASLTFANYVLGLDQSITDIRSCEAGFTRDLSALLSMLKETSQVDSEHCWALMVARLDYSGFYSSAI